MANLTELRQDLKTLQKMALQCQKLILKTRSLEARCLRVLRISGDQPGANENERKPTDDPPSGRWAPS